MNVNQLDLVWMNILDGFYEREYFGLTSFVWASGHLVTRYVFLHPISQGVYPQSTLPPQQFQPAAEVQTQIFSPNPKTTTAAGGNLAKWAFSPQNQVTGQFSSDHHSVRTQVIKLFLKPLSSDICNQNGGPVDGADQDLPQG